jgi:hypothetical protein
VKVEELKAEILKHQAEISSLNHEVRLGTDIRVLEQT